MATTLQANVFNPQVLTDMVTARIPQQLALAGTGAVEVISYPGPGSTITIPNWQGITNFAAITEDTGLTASNMDQASDTAVMQGYGLQISLSDEALLSSYADPEAELATQIAKRAARTIDLRLIVEAETTSLSSTTGATFAVNDLIGAVITNWKDEGFARLDDGTIGGYVVVHSKVFGDIAKLTAFQTASTLGYAPNVIQANPLNVVGSIAGFQVVVSDQITTVAGTPNTYRNLIIKPNGLFMAYKRRVLVETARGTTVGIPKTFFMATVYFATALRGVGTGLLQQAVKLITQ